MQRKWLDLAKQIIEKMRTTPRHELFVITLVVLSLVTAGFGLVIFLEVLDELIEGSLKPIDIWLLSVIAPYRSDTLFTIAITLHNLLRIPYVLLISLPFLIYLLAKRYIMPAIVMTIMSAFSLATIWLIKEVVGRDRPEMGTIAEIGMSFPSGHSAGSVVVYGAITYIIWRYMTRSTILRVLTGLLAAALVVATGLSRIYLRVHFPSDVVAGWAVGIVLLFVTVAVLEYMHWRQSCRQQV